MIAKVAFEAEVSGKLKWFAAGDKVQISGGPNQTWGSDHFGLRAKVFKRGAAGTVECPSWRVVG